MDNLKDYEYKRNFKKWLSDQVYKADKSSFGSVKIINNHFNITKNIINYGNNLAFKYKFNKKEIAILKADKMEYLKEIKIPINKTEAKTLTTLNAFNFDIPKTLSSKIITAIKIILNN